MGFYFRKTIGKGPFRMTFSKSGISFSAGVKGARVRISPKGTYVTLSSKGIRYQKRISGYESGNNGNSQHRFPIPLEQPHTITSGDVDQITDIDSQNFIDELKEKESKLSYYKTFGQIPMILSAMALLFLFFSIQEPVKETETLTNTFVVSSGYGNVNIRTSAGASGKIIGVIKPGDRLEMRDDSYANWYKVSFEGTDAFVSKEFSETEVETTTLDKPLSAEAVMMYNYKLKRFWAVAIGLGILYLILLPQLKKADRKRLSVDIYYEMDDSIKKVYEQFVSNFSRILESSKVWQYIHSVNTENYKYSSGASSSVTRRPLLRILKNNTPSKIFRTNVEIPYLGLINTELFFFPERIVIRRGNDFGAIMYKNVECYDALTRFIESDPLPSDARVVGHTWRYLNKNGTPDRRFSNNYQLPICQYSEYSFRSSSGLNEQIATSRPGVFDDFLRFIKLIGQLQKQVI